MTKEKEILALYNQGKKNRDIAKELGIHHRTVQYWLKKHNLKAHYFGQPINIVSATEAKCSKCGDVKLLTEFQFGRKGKQYQYQFSYCNDCRKKQSYLALNNNIEAYLTDRYNRLVARAKKNKIDCTISKEEFIQQYKKQGGKCFYTDYPLICEVGTGHHNHSLSIDKIMPFSGYTKDNTVFCTNRINTVKSDLLLTEIYGWMPKFWARIEKHFTDLGYDIDGNENLIKLSKRS